jgi:protein-disulfide isomerase
MRTLLVNGLASLAIAATSTGGCSHADARGANPFGQAATDSIVKKADAGRITGAPTAKVWVVEISDLQCPYCKEWHDNTFPVVRDEYVKTGKVRLAYVNFPLRQHVNSQAAATAAMCASAQGKFWEMHDALFESQEKWEMLKDPSAFYEGLASKAGVNIADWKKCTEEKPLQPLIDADMDRAKRAGVESTPSFIIGGRLVAGSIPPAEMRKYINDALAKAK